MVWRMEIIAKLYPIIANLYPGYSLATIYTCQFIPWVEFGYDLCTPNHTLSNINVGCGLASTAARYIYLKFKNVRNSTRGYYSRLTRDWYSDRQLQFNQIEKKNRLPSY